jgi:drug/metabolite transporter (DMT)-like permease
MTGAFLTLFFFAVTAVFAGRAAVLVGPVHANFARLLLAVLLLGTWAHSAGMGLGGVSFLWFFLSGIVGFGVGGLAMFQSLPRLGSSLSTLIVQCCTVLVAAAGEWLWLGTVLSWPQLGAILLTLAGVVLGLAPGSWPIMNHREWRVGLAWAFLSAVGQGIGAVISRKAYVVARSGFSIPDPGTTAYQRALGGILVALIAVIFIRRTLVGSSERKVPPSFSGVGTAFPWIAANTLTGPVLGVTCYQWALSTTPAGIVQPIVAAAPLLTIPFAWWIEGRRPRPIYYAGAVLAVAGVSALYLLRP